MPKTEVVVTRIYTYTVPIEEDMVDAFCVVQKGFTDQFVYYDKLTPNRHMGLGRCIAIPALAEADVTVQGPVDLPPVFFSFNRFDANNPSPCDPLFAAFPSVALMLPEIVLTENEAGTYLQVNSLGPVYEGRVARFLKMIRGVRPRVRETIPFALEPDSREAWGRIVDASLAAIRAGRIAKVVPSRRKLLRAERPFSSKDLLVNLIDGPARGTVLLYRYGDVFFCGCTPELLVRKRGSRVESMCLAGTCPAGADEAERARLADGLLHDEKNLREHGHVVDFIRAVFERDCYNVDIPRRPGIMPLQHIQHLHTPASADVLDGLSVLDLCRQLHPTPALAGAPVGEALMLLRQVEPYNRGFFGGACGYVDGNGDGEFAVAIRSGVFDGEIGYVYAGCGVVEGSDAAAEFDEIDLKLQTVLTAFDGKA